jgi:hypothetical protein
MEHYLHTDGTLTIFTHPPVESDIPTGAKLLTSDEEISVALGKGGILAEAKTNQIKGAPFAATPGALVPSYNAAISANINFTSAGGVTKAYQADAKSLDLLHKEVTLYSTCSTPAATPAGYYWVSADNTQVPFTLADLQGLAAAIGARGVAAFQNLQAKKSAVLASADIASVQAITF